MTLIRRLGVELLGSALLTTIVVGSGIAAQRLSPTDVGLQLLQNVVAIALGLPVLIVLFEPISGAHFNPVVSLVDAASGYRSWREAGLYIPAQIIGAVIGAMLGNVMFDIPPINISTNERLTPAHFLAEIVATAGLIMVIFVLARTERSRLAPIAVAAYIGAACYFTSSACFVNPAITIGRMLSDTFTGIAPGSGLGYIAAQLLGAALGFVVVGVVYPKRRSVPAI